MPFFDIGTQVLGAERELAWRIKKYVAITADIFPLQRQLQESSNKLTLSRLGGGGGRAFDVRANFK